MSGVPAEELRPPELGMRVARREPLGDGLPVEHPGACHARRLEERRRDEVVERHARGVLDELGQDEVARVAVAELRAGREIERLFLRLFHEAPARAFLRHDGEVLLRAELERLLVVRNARRVAHELLHGDGLPGVGTGREMRADRVVEAELSCVAQLERRHRREHLRDRRDGVPGLGRVRRAPRDVREAVALAEEDAVALRDEDRAAEAAELRPRREVPVERVREGSGRGGRRGEREGGKEE